MLCEENMSASRSGYWLPSLLSQTSWETMLWIVCVFLMAVCKDSYVVYACCFDRVGKWSGFAGSMRIAINTMIFRHLCHLALYHWRGKTLLFLCDSRWFTKKPWNLFGMILDDSWKTLDIYLGWFLMICKKTLKFIWGDSQQFMKNWNLFGVILNDS